MTKSLKRVFYPLWLRMGLNILQFRCFQFSMRLDTLTIHSDRPVHWISNVHTRNLAFHPQKCQKDTARSVQRFITNIMRLQAGFHYIVVDYLASYLLLLLPPPLCWEGNYKPVNRKTITTTLLKNLLYIGFLSLFFFFLSSSCKAVAVHILGSSAPGVSSCPLCNCVFFFIVSTWVSPNENMSSQMDVNCFQAEIIFLLSLANYHKIY